MATTNNHLEESGKENNNDDDNMNKTSAKIPGNIQYIFQKILKNREKKLKKNLCL